MRLFVALALPPPIQDALAALPDLPGSRRVVREQLHLTLRFIGQLPAADEVARAEAEAALAERLAALRAPPLTLALAGLGAFPERGKPTVLWAGLAPSPPLMALARAVDDAVAAPHPDGDRPFLPHVTVARLKDTPRAQLAALTLSPTAPFVVREVGLYASRLERGGAVHTRLRAYPLEVASR